MTRRIVIWLTDEQNERLTKKAQALEVNNHEVVTLATLLVLGESIPKKVRKRQIFLLEHELKTRQEKFSRDPNSAYSRVLAILEDEAPLSTPEIIKLSGKDLSAVYRVLNEHPEVFTRVSPPKSLKKQKGRPAIWWGLN
jgi:hypothetical protein